MRKRGMHVITRPEQLRALVSPVRQELLDVMARMGTVSIAEVAAVLGRPADGLYYHVRALQRVGLVEAAGTRRGGVREEALFRAKAGQFAIRYPQAIAGRRAMTAIVGAMLRLGARDFARALARGDVRVEGPQREVWALRTTGWLTPARLRDVNRHIAALSAAATQAGPAGRLYAVTILLTPLVHRDNKTGRRPRKQARR
ncbi:MAG TPA: helix-turn-helix domain-containing protein [Gemmatimonadales bacterium]|nr:helix-turn-helix domain-containing protein [Gemmatimonadales bacterium]